MQLTKKQTRLMATIQNCLQRGDIKEIANQTGYTREYVGKCLNSNGNYFNQLIVEAAIKIISQRAQTAVKHLEVLIAR